ncbi:MAG: exodeoxyribonuclease III [Lewinellaceae bacterium]|nr:exodeoxyribonuclease III [Saprospiraceae bacterium]MCB9337755.1 exodeoxyribonuclease III [Lewinellaceae bacterium]
MPLTIISYNVNGIRAAMGKSLFDWVAGHDADIVCLQETKAQPEQVDFAPIDALGYKHYWHSAEKKGYSGVATFSKREPDKVVVGCGMEKYDREGRILRTDFGDWSLLNCYFPSGTSGEERQAFKYEFLDDFFNWINELKKERPKLIIVGDYNIAHTENDIHSPKTNQQSSGFLPEERAWMTKWFSHGFTDAFRQVHPEKVEYSWWSFRANARANNKGWRIDYQSVTDNLKDKVLDVRHVGEAVHSDHCPVWMQIDL